MGRKKNQDQMGKRKRKKKAKSNYVKCKDCEERFHFRQMSNGLCYQCLQERERIRIQQEKKAKYLKRQANGAHKKKERTKAHRPGVLNPDHGPSYSGIGEWHVTDEEDN